MCDQGSELVVALLQFSMWESLQEKKSLSIEIAISFLVLRSEMEGKGD